MQYLDIIKKQSGGHMFITKEDTKYAIMDLYEELYDSANAINPDTIFESMKTLMKAYNLEDFMEGLDMDLLNVIHESERLK